MVRSETGKGFGAQLVTISPVTQKTGVLAGHCGACEAHLYQFTGVANGEGQPPVKRVAASDLHETIAYMRKWHSDLDTLRVELVALIELVCGSPLN